MTVTQISELNKSRSKVYIDGEFAFVLYKGEIRLYHIKVGSEITQEDYRRILTEVLPKRAKLRAMNLLMKKEYTEAELRKKLREGYYPENIIDEAIDYIISYKYLDDLRYATDYIVAHEDTRSHRRIEQDLLNKGVSKTTLENAWLAWEKLGGEQNEESMIEKLLAKRKYNPDTADLKEQQRTYAFLMRKGFDSDVIQKVMKTYETFL